MGRLHSLEALELVSDGPHLRLDSITRLAASILDAPVALASVIQTNLDRQFFTASTGLSDDLTAARQTPLDVSICRFVQQADTLLDFPDLHEDPRTTHNGLIRAHGLRSYIGAPIHAVGGRPIGALCCMTKEPRHWTEAQKALLLQLAACVDDQIELSALRLEAQRAQEKLGAIAKARSGFIAHISHELRTPLTGIIGSIRLLDSFNLGATAGELVGVLNRSSARLVDIMNDTLDLAKIDSGFFSIKMETCDLDAIAADIVAQYQQAAQDKPVILGWNSTLRTTHYRVDRKALVSVLDSLFANAVHFTAAGTADLNLLEDTSGNVVIRVVDTGCGIHHDQLAHLFDEFERASPRVARKFGGTGLGMAMVRRLVELMDGDISVESRINQGTVITITLPLEPVETVAPSLLRRQSG